MLPQQRSIIRVRLSDLQASDYAEAVRDRGSRSF